MPVDGEFEVLRHDVGVDPPPAGGFETQSASIAFDSSRSAMTTASQSRWSDAVHYSRTPSANKRPN